MLGIDPCKERKHNKIDKQTELPCGIRSGARSAFKCLIGPDLMFDSHSALFIILLDFQKNYISKEKMIYVCYCPISLKL